MMRRNSRMRTVPSITPLGSRVPGFRRMTPPWGSSVAASMPAICKALVLSACR